MNVIADLSGEEIKISVAQLNHVAIFINVKIIKMSGKNVTSERIL